MAVVLAGIPVSPGVAAGPVARMAAPPTLPAGGTRDAGAPEAEAKAALDALETVASGLEERAGRAPAEAAAVLSAQAMMARDPTLADKVSAATAAGRTAVDAVAGAFGEYREMLAAAGPYLAERVADLDDIRNRTVAALLGVPMPGVPDPGHPYVLVAVDLAPADTATLDPANVLAIVTEQGGPTSHTAILAKSLSIPAVVGCGEASVLADGQIALVDGAEGSVTVAPDEAVVRRALADQEARRAVVAATSGPGRTADGRPVQLLVNIGGDKDLAAAAAADSEGVGLFRTEFLFLDRPSAPTVDEQRETYGRVFDAFAGRKVVVRTLDAGADKPLRFVSTPDEPNPALGVRGLRTARRHPELLETQLEAIAAAAASSDAEVWVMAPMVSTAAEAGEFADAVHRHGLPTAGAMVEVPAAALRAHQLTARCDFLSLGTNDLSQYAYAADRMAAELADLLDPWQPGLLELVRLTAEAGRVAGRPVGVCGEAASNPLLALVLVGLGVTSLSMAPVSVPEVRAALALHTVAECRGLAGMALDAEDGRSGRTAVRAAARGAVA
jgi:phosphoenolpyruvate-protein phosphotransferase (PTS system enzyme I)